ncbi:hypothetical protein [Haladaptatus sp. ZSTT2]|uniref:hypothetical protein n=1 Tax=Haladaptatus sp. ZSTT2 TaxID=3120515 RepID=UPI00300F0562
MRLHTALTLVLVCSIGLAGCVGTPSGQSTTTTTTTVSTTTQAISTGEPTETTSTTTRKADYTSPPEHNLRIKSELNKTANVTLTIATESNGTVLQRHFNIDSNAGIRQNLNYTGPRGAEYTVTVTHGNTTVTKRVEDPWRHQLYIKVTADDLSISVFAV